MASSKAVASVVGEISGRNVVVDVGYLERVRVSDREAVSRGVDDFQADSMSKFCVEEKRKRRCIYFLKVPEVYG